MKQHEEGTGLERRLAALKAGDPVFSHDYEAFWDKYEEWKLTQGPQPTFRRASSNSAALLDPGQSLLTEQLTELRAAVCRKLIANQLTDEEIAALMP